MITRLAKLLQPLASRVAPATLSLGGLGAGVGAAWTQGTFWGLLGTMGGCFLADLCIDRTPPAGGR